MMLVLLCHFEAGAAGQNEKETEREQSDYSHWRYSVPGLWSDGCRRLQSADPCRPPPLRPPGGHVRQSGSGRRRPERWAGRMWREEKEHGVSKTFRLCGSVIHPAGLYLHFTLVGGFDVEVKQEVGAGESSAIRPQLNTARRIRLRVNPTTSQVVVWDLWRTRRQTKAWSGWCVCVCEAACSSWHRLKVQCVTFERIYYN